MYFEDNITAFRNAQFGGDTQDGDWVIKNVDWHAATFKLSIGTAKGEVTGSISKTLNNAAAGSEGISASYNAAYADPDTGEVGPATTIRVQISKASMQGLPAATPAANSIELYYDLHVTPSGAAEFVLCSGTFTVDPGVTF